MSAQRSGPEQISSKEQDDFDFALYFLDLLCRNVSSRGCDAALAMAECSGTSTRARRRWLV
jgi:hypothetical protein